MMFKTKKLMIALVFAMVFTLILCGSTTAADPSNSTLSTDQSINTQKTTIYPDPQIIRGGSSTGIVYTTIQDAINNAQTGDTIRLDNGATFNEHDLTIPDGITNLTFDVWNASHTGPGGQAIIDAGGNGRIIYIPPGVTVNLNNITFANGKASDYGGAIYNYAGSCTVNSCTFTGNQASYFGGAIHNDSGSCTVTGCTFTGNQSNEGGAISNWYGYSCTVTDSTFTGNQATDSGGAIYNYGNSCTVTGCTFTGNQALVGGAIFNYYGSCTVSCCTFTNNTSSYDGGAIYNGGDSCTVTDSTFTGNQARNGSAIYIDSYNNSIIQFNRILNNNHPDIYSVVMGCDATNNWWGTNFEGTTPLAAGRVNDTVNANTWIILTVYANSILISPLGGTSTVIANLQHDNNHQIPTGGQVPDGVNITFSTNPSWGTITDITPSSSTTLNGQVTATYKATGSVPYPHSVQVYAIVDNENNAYTIINLINQPPTLTSPGDRSVNEGQQLMFQLSGNDPNGDTLTYSASGLPVGATLNPNTGVFSWTPSFSPSNDYPVTFTVTDNGGLWDSKNVLIHVNRPPTLTSTGDQTVYENQPLTFTLIGTDPNTGDSLTYSASGLPVGAILDPTGVFSWIPSFSQSGTYPVIFTVTDASGLFDSKTINIVVNNVNRAPTLVSSGDKSVDENQLLTFQLVGSDPDVGDTLAYSATGLPVGAILDPNTGVFSWTPSFSQSGTYPVIFIVTDVGGLFDSKTANIVVNNVNRAPTLGSVGDRSVDENQLLTFQLVGSDPDVGDTLAYSATGLPVGAVLDPNSGVFSWTPSFSQSGSYPVTFTVTDGNLSDIKTISIVVNNVNRAPTLGSVGDKSVNENQLLTFTLTGSDPDAGEILTYSSTGLPTGATLNSNTGVFSWTPSFSQSGTYHLTFTITDAGGLSNSKTVTIMVNNVNIADLQVKVVSSDSLPAVDRKFAFMVYIKNNGPNDATNVTVNVPIPAGLIYNYYISTQGTYKGSIWTVGKIKSGSRVFLYICATPQTSYVGKSLTLTATPTIKEYDPTPVAGSTTIKISRISRIALVLFSVFMLYEIFQS